MTKEQLIAKIEALLFIYGEAMDYKKLAGVLKVEVDEVQTAIQVLKENLKLESRGLFLVENKDRVQLTTKPEFAGLLEAVIKEELHESLTPVALETLAIVTYAGPLLRSEIEYIRGVNSSFTLRNLLIRGLIERAQDPKRANAFLYNASMDLMKHLGIGNLTELPEYDKFRQLIEALRNPQNDRPQ